MMEMITRINVLVCGLHKLSVQPHRRLDEEGMQTLYTHVDAKLNSGSLYSKINLLSLSSFILQSRKGSFLSHEARQNQNVQR